MLISLIIPFYQGNKYIKRIKKMAENNAKSLIGKAELELIIVNDSPWIAIPEQELEDSFYRFHIITNEHNLGIQGARIEGVKAAQGEYIMMLDQDDEIVKSCLEKHLDAIGNADVSVSDGYRVDDGNKKKIYGNVRQQRKVKRMFWYIYLENRILSPGQCLIRKSAIPELWCANIMKKNGADDLLLWIMLFGDGCKFTTVNLPLYKHNTTGENVSSDEELMAESTYEMLDILIKHKCVGKVYQRLLKRKIENDVCFIKNGKDKFVDYKCIEFARKILNRTR